MNDLPSGAEILRSSDARDWAEAFVKHVKAIPGLAEDQETMTTWFANAIMRGYDAAKRQDHPPPPAKTIPGLPAGLYRHCNGGVYLLLGIAQHSENDDELLAVYVSLDASLAGPRLRVRLLQSWGERFAYIGLDPRAGRTCRICKKSLELSELGQTYGTAEITSILCDTCADKRMAE